jgi:thiol-disulfide isomerase/thioredoxin
MYIIILVCISLVFNNFCACQETSNEENINPFIELFGPTLYSWKNEKEAIELPTHELLKDKKVIGIYFSASWCGPCRQFTPILIEFYQRMKSKGKKFEIIFISRDQNAEQFGEYYSKMPWLAVPLPGLNKILEKLAPKYQVLLCMVIYCTYQTNDMIPTVVERYSSFRST